MQSFHEMMQLLWVAGHSIPILVLIGGSVLQFSVLQLIITSDLFIYRYAFDSGAHFIIEELSGRVNRVEQ